MVVEVRLGQVVVGAVGGNGIDNGWETGGSSCSGCGGVWLCDDDDSK